MYLLRSGRTIYKNESAAIILCDNVTEQINLLLYNVSMTGGD